MFTVFNSFYSRIPALSTVAAAVALLRGWACCAFCYHLRRVRPAGRCCLVNHWRAKSYNKIVRLAVQVILNPRFTRWHPVLGVRGELAYFIDLVKVLHVLHVAGVMPSEVFLSFDLCYNCSGPQLTIQAGQSHVLCSLDGFVSCIVTLQSVARAANAVFNFS